MKLSKRLERVASYVPDNSSIIDVGCDHALLDIYLYNKRKNIKIIASDINEKPLSIARENIKKHGLEDKIKVILNDGIKNIPSDIDTIVISGMGGVLISDILSDKNNLKNIKNLILCPNNDFPIVRKILYKNNFKIIKEELLTEKNITYLIIKAVSGHEKINCFFGSLNNKDLEVIYYYTKLLNTNTNILKKLPKKYLIKKIKLKIENKRIKSFLEKH